MGLLSIWFDDPTRLATAFGLFSAGLAFALQRVIREETDEVAPHVTAGDRPAPGPVSIHKVVPWFIVAFLALATLHSLALIPAAALAPTASLANVLTVLSTAALGLGVDVRVVARAGERVTAAVCGSLALLGLISVALIHGLGAA